MTEATGGAFIATSRPGLETCAGIRMFGAGGESGDESPHSKTLQRFWPMLHMVLAWQR